MENGEMGTTKYKIQLKKSETKRNIKNIKE